MAFTLDARLQDDCFVIGRLELCRLLLMNNAAVPWFILVPETEVTEICDLAEGEQAMLWHEVDRVAKFVRGKYPVDKMNVAAIGNVVQQLHVHVVGRREDDYCWPGVVWGEPVPSTYTKEEFAAIGEVLMMELKGLSQ